MSADPPSPRLPNPPVPCVLRGGCACGALGFSVDDAFGYALNCHCGRCRRSTGGAFKPFGGIPRAQLNPDAASPADVLRVGEAAGNHDVRCARCGSLLFSVVRDGAFVHVPYGVLHDAPSLPPQAHIFVGSKAAWFEITDGLPQHDALP